ncbi:MAG: MBL fold metallo-hydrolase [Gammaproteobacteria bacterium]|nr:MBL fold metallo-hydrolase [Gammaproteobacteria bacterium]
MQFASLGSGSKGNSTIIRSETTQVLVDCGFSLSQFEKRLQNLSVNPSDIDAILVTHEHADHGAGVIKIAQKYQIPVYTTVGTARALGLDVFEVVHGAEEINLGELKINAVTVPHDAAEPVQFTFVDQKNHCKFGLLTDTGHVTPHMRNAYDDCDGLLLEFNYDDLMLQQGPYPANLKQRIAGGFGHLSNQQSLEMLGHMKSEQLTCLIAAHISEKNNSPELVANLLKPIPLSITPVLACQQHGFSWKEL